MKIYVALVERHSGKQKDVAGLRLKTDEGYKNLLADDAFVVALSVFVRVSGIGSRDCCFFYIIFYRGYFLLVSAVVFLSTRLVELLLLLLLLTKLRKVLLALRVVFPSRH